MVLCNMCIVLFNANLTLCNALLVFSIFDKSRRNKCQEIWCEMLRGYKSLWSLPMHQPEHWHVAKNRPQGRFQVLQNSGIWMSKDVQVRVKTLSVGDCNWRNLRKYRALQYKSARASPLTGSTPRKMARGYREFHALLDLNPCCRLHCNLTYLWGICYIEPWKKRYKNRHFLLSFYVLDLQFRIAQSEYWDQTRYISIHDSKPLISSYFRIMQRL